MTMDKCVLRAGVQHFPMKRIQFAHLRDSLKLSTINFLLLLGHWGHKRRPPGSKRAPASRKASFPRQVATKRRSFHHGGGLEPNVKLSKFQRNIQIYY